MSTPTKGGAPQSPFHVREYSPVEFQDLLTPFFEPMTWYHQSGTKIAEMSFEKLSQKTDGVMIVVADKR